MAGFSAPCQESGRRLSVLDGLDRQTLAVAEVFRSIQGESSWAGWPCTFVRLAGCHLRCTYCDTRYALTAAVRRSVDEVVREVLAWSDRLVEVTGGEPLLQEAVYPLMTRLADAGRTVLLETSGSLDISRVDPRVRRIVDLKCPSSGQSEYNRYSNIDHLRPADEVKFVIGTRQDYEWARQAVRQHRLADRCTVLMGVVYGRLAPAELVSWILDDGLPVRFQLQMHKYIWEPSARGV